MREKRQRYRDDSMVLETEFVCDGGVVRIVDFMAMGSRCDVVRIVEGVDGEVPLEMLLDVRFGYGAEYAADRDDARRDACSWPGRTP